MPDNTCAVCHIGTLHARRASIAQPLDRHLVLLPNVAVWVCDVCGDHVYDPDVTSRLRALLGLPADEPSSRRQSGSLAEDDDPPTNRFQGRRGA